MDKTEDRKIKWSFEPIETKKASDLIVDQIKEMIIKGDLKAGDRLPSERTLMTVFQKSRPTIREALRVLESNGLIKTRHGSSGAEVVNISESYVTIPLSNYLALNQVSYTELAEIRELIEIHAVGIAAEKCTKEDIEHMRDIISRASNVKDDIEAYLNLDLEFHEAFCQASHNKFAMVIDSACHDMIKDILQKSYFLKTTDDARKEMLNETIWYHSIIIDSLQNHDPEQARKLLRQHLERFKQACRRVSMENK